MPKSTHQKKVALTKTMISRGGPTLVGLTIANALDEIMAEVRTQGGGSLDPMSIRVSTEPIEMAFGEPSLGVTVTIDQRNVIEVARG